ncbi:unnamed protein product [Lathyrus oleraceus]|uniref:Protein kinase domain-containing protein n=1 Tax=Pisum sativum TaxID=3888 RepID=A0A9D4W9H8_PEA|nr:probable inactive receptor kinase At1g48480 [Pisum sativum]KAI5396790.1 hypothetical protein KIW84_062857 [Pisum sativum]
MKNIFLLHFTVCLSGGAIAGMVIGCVFGLLLILVLLVSLCRKSAQSVDVESGTGDGDVSNADSGSAWISTSAILDDLLRASEKSLVFGENVSRKFSLDDLLKGPAVDLGKGTFGKSYKVALEMGVTVAVKSLKDVTASEREFKEKIVELGKLFHEKLVPLRSYYYKRDKNLIVYDYMPMGSLSTLLHGRNGTARTPLNWETRSTIALGAAQGIAYLHSQSPTFCHGNIRSSNILLTECYESRVSDFGLAYLALPSAAPNRVSGYRAPEVTDTRRVSQKADVYSFGIMLLELITGKDPTRSLLNEGVDLPRWVQSIIQDEWNTQVFDMELLLCLHAEDEMVKLLRLALKCTDQYPDKRPSMDVVVCLIEKICHTSLVKRREYLFKMERIDENIELKRGTL